MVSSDEHEFVEFISGRLPQLRRVARALCGDWDRGDDVVQRTVTELYAKWPQARRADNIDAFVRTMLMRRFLDERRRPWARVRLLDAMPEVAAPAAVDPAVRLDLHSALARLAPGQRAVVVLRFWYDLSIEQSADILRCSPGNVKSQAARGLATLRGLLGVAADTGKGRDHA